MRGYTLVWYHIRRLFIYASYIYIYTYYISLSCISISDTVDQVKHYSNVFRTYGIYRVTFWLPTSWPKSRLRPRRKEQLCGAGEVGLCAVVDLSVPMTYMSTLCLDATELSASCIQGMCRISKCAMNSRWLVNIIRLAVLAHIRSQINCRRRSRW